MEIYERILLVKPEVFVYKIPPRSTARGYRAADWNLEKPDWTLRLRVIAKDKLCSLKLEDKTSGELFGECPVDTYPGTAIEQVTDSSRYFVVRLQDASGRSAFLGLGFGDRSDSFDMNVSLQDHFKWVTTSEQLSKEEASDNKPKLDLAFKEGQMIKINIGKKSATSTKAPASSSGSLPGLLPPPPSGASSGMLRGPPSQSSTPQVSSMSSSGDLPQTSSLNNTGPSLFDLDPLSSGETNTASKSAEGWSDYSAAGASKAQTSDNSWTNF